MWTSSSRFQDVACGSVVGVAAQLASSPSASAEGEFGCCIGCASRAKALMGLQATAALLTSLIVIARAVRSLGGGSG